VGLVPDGLHTAVDTESIGGVHDHLSGVDVGEVDSGGAEFLGQREPVGLKVDDEGLGCAADVGAVRGHQPDGAGAEDRDGSAGVHTGEFGAVVTGGKDVGQHGEVVLVLGAGR
jgi:hypothetical protein